jgi:heme oxygenase
MDGDARLDRTVRITIDGLGATGYRARIARIDAHHSNILDGYPADVAWPDDQLWQTLHERDHLDEHDLHAIGAGENRASLEISVPMPGVVRVRLTPSAEEGSR